MKFAKALRVLLVLGLFQQADADNAVIVTIGQSGSHVFMEWSGSLAAFPPTAATPFSFVPRFISDDKHHSMVMSGTGFKCKCRLDFMIMTFFVVFV